MKRIALFMLLVALFAVGASALQVSSPTIGGEKQDRLQNVTATFTITNNANQTLSGISIQPVADAKYALSFQNVPSSIAPNSASTVTVIATVPLDHPGVNPATLKVESIKIGTFTVSGTLNDTPDSASGDLKMQAVNQLEIKKARIECESKSQSLDEGDRVKNLKPGNQCSLEVEVENKFADNDRNGQKIGDIEFDSVRVTLDSSNSDVDVDGDDDIDNLGADEEDSIVFDVDIDDEADDRTVTLEIVLSGNDQNGALHGEKRTVRLEVVRLSHDIQIKRVELSPNRVSNCDATTVQLAATVLNQGKRDEKKVAVEVSVSDLKFTKKVQDLTLDKDDQTGVSFDVPVPKGQKKGVVRVDVRTFFDNLAQSNTGSVELTIEGCDESADETEDAPKVQPPVVQPPVVTPPAGTGVAAPRTSKSSFTDSPAYVALLVVASVVVLAMLVLMASMLVRRKQA